MTGTIVNAVAIIAGSLIGLLFKKGIKKSYELSIFKALGLSTLIIGLNGVISNMFSVSDGHLSSSGELLLCISLIIGTLVGEMLKLEKRVNNFSDKVGEKFNIGNFSKGFVSASILFCVGAMAVVGAINDGLYSDPSILFVKSTLDGTVAIIFASTLGIGTIFSAITVFVYQGAISLLAVFLGGYLQGEILMQICMIGYAIIMCIGFNFIADTKIKTMNMIPALLVPIIYDLLKSLWAMI